MLKDKLQEFRVANQREKLDCSNIDTLLGDTISDYKPDQLVKMDDGNCIPVAGLGYTC